MEMFVWLLAVCQGQGAASADGLLAGSFEAAQVITLQGKKQVRSSLYLPCPSYKPDLLLGPHHDDLISS